MEGVFWLTVRRLDQILPFYSKDTKLHYKLKREKLVAANNDIFLCAFLDNAISCKELQTVVKKFLQDGKGMHKQILEVILTDYRTQETGEELRKGESIVPKKVRCVETVRDFTQKSDKVALPTLPSNTGNLTPHSYYLKLKTWYEVMRILEVS